MILGLRVCFHDFAGNPSEMGIFLWTMWDFCFPIIASKDGMPNHRRRDAELIQTATGDVPVCKLRGCHYQKVACNGKLTIGRSFPRENREFPELCWQHRLTLR